MFKKYFVKITQGWMSGYYALVTGINHSYFGMYGSGLEVEVFNISTERSVGKETVSDGYVVELKTPTLEDIGKIIIGYNPRIPEFYVGKLDNIENDFAIIQPSYSSKRLIDLKYAAVTLESPSITTGSHHCVPVNKPMFNSIYRACAICDRDMI